MMGSALRSTLDSRYAGAGTSLAFSESEESYENRKQHVKFEHDYDRLKSDEFDKLCESLASEVKVYKV